MTFTSTQFTGARKLNVVKTLAGHETCFVDLPDGRRIEALWGPAISYFPDGERMISGYEDKTARLWDLKAGKEVEEARLVLEERVYEVAVSRDNRWVIAACEEGLLKSCEMKTGIIKSLKGHSSDITTIDISRDSKLLVSGSLDGTTQIWDLEIGNLVASTSTSPDFVSAVRFSQDSKKLAVMSRTNFDVWNIEARKLESKIRKNYYHSAFGVPVFWTTKDRTIVAAFPLDDQDTWAKMIHEIDSSTLEIVGAPFQGHTSYILGLELSFDCTLLISVSDDNTIKLWAFESRHLLATFDVQNIFRITLLPNARQLAYTIRKSGRHSIYICDIPLDIVAKLWPGQEAPNSDVRKNVDPLGFNATIRRAAVYRNPVPVPVAAQPSGRPPTIQQQESSALRYFRQLISRKDKISTIVVEPCDPLDRATSPRLSSKSSSVPITNFMHHNSGANSGMLPISKSTTRSSSFTSRLRRLSKWWPTRIAHPLPPIIDVPLAEGQTRNAAGGAPAADDGYVLDEFIDSRPTSRSSTSQCAPSENHGSGRLCLCL